MRSIVLLLSASLLTPAAIAIPNIWSSGFGQGIAEHVIKNEQGDTFTLSCDVGYSDNGDLTGVSFVLANGQDLSPADNHKVELLIDGNGYWLPEKLGWRNGDNAWASFLEVITKASAFDVYVDDKKMASFSPTPQSTKTVLGDLSGCTYRYSGM
ncbi:hypothetical protein [Aeromonas sobria]|uniref:hypothetical protein n=1 Tax=Aeromonas sobria TaxID=646 RepID=UPI003F31BB68